MLLIRLPFFVFSFPFLCIFYNSEQSRYLTLSLFCERVKTIIITDLSI